MTTIADLEGRTLRPISDLLSAADFPDFAFDVGDVARDLLDKVYYAYASIHAVENGLRYRVTLVFPEELSISLMGSDAFSFLIGGSGGATVVDAEGIVGCDWRLTLHQMTFGVRVSPDVLALESDGTGATISVSADIHINRDLDIWLDNVSGASLPRSRLLGTDLIVSAADVKLSLSENNPIPEAVGHAGFKGLYAGALAVEIPAEYLSLDSGSVALTISDALIGTTGFTGAVSLTPGVTEPVTGNLLGFPFRLRGINLDFRQNAFVAALLAVDLRLAYFEDGSSETWIGVDMTLGRGIGFAATLSAAQPPEADTTLAPNYLVSLPVAGVLRLDVSSFSVEAHDDTWVAQVGGAMTFLFSGAEDWPGVVFSRIGFTPEPRLLLPDGAGVEFTKPLDAAWNGFQVSVTKLALGSVDAEHDPGRLRLSLSAAVHFGGGLPAGASVKGMTVDWGAGRGVSIGFDGIGLEFGAPGTFQFAGSVSYVADGTSHEFRGAASLDLIALDAGVDVAIVVGRHNADATHSQSFNYVYLYADAKLLPSGIPIGNTGLSIYGFAGLVAYNMALDLDTSLPADERFYEIFTRTAIGIQHQYKWVKMHGQNAVGLGMTIGTADAGFSFNAKGLLAVTFPDVNLLLQARSKFISPRVDLTSSQEGTFETLLAYCARERTLSFDILGSYLIPNVVSVAGKARAFFDFDDLSAWYVALGERDDMVTAKVIKLGSWLFDAGFWRSIAAAGVAAGAELRIDFYKKSGGFWVRARGVAGGEMYLFWDPPQWEGRVYLQGELSAGYRGVGITVTLDGEARARTARPTYFHAHLEACIKIKLLFRSIKVCRGFTFEWKSDNPPIPSVAFGSWTAQPRHHAAIPTSTAAGSLPAPLATSVVLDEGVSGVPMDAEITIDFTHPMVTAQFDDWIALNNDGFETVGSQSGYSLAYRLDAVGMVRDPNGANEEVAVWGTWQRGLQKPNLRLALFSQEHFCDNGSVSRSYLEDINIDYCDPVVQTTVCIPLATGTVVAGGSSCPSDAVIIEASDGVVVAGGGTTVPRGESIRVRFRDPVVGVTVHVDGGKVDADGTRGGRPAGPVVVVSSGGQPPGDEGGHVNWPSLAHSRWCHLPWQLANFTRTPGRLVAFAVLYLLLWTGALLLVLRHDPRNWPLGLVILIILTLLTLMILLLAFICGTCRRPLGTGTASGSGSGPESGKPGTGTGSSTPGTDTPGSGSRNTGTKATGASGTSSSGTDPKGTGSTKPSDEVIITGDARGAGTVSKICFQLGHGPGDWALQSQRGGSISETPSWEMTGEQRLLRPNTEYELKVVYTSRLKHAGIISETAEVRTRRFTTGGPPRLAGALAPYVIEQYPTDGARPVFCGYDIAVRFNEDYVALMYWLSGDRLSFRLFDQDGQPVRDADGNPVLLANPWALEPKRYVTAEENYYYARILRNVTQGCIASCARALSPNTIVTRLAVSDGLGKFALSHNSKYDVWLVADSDIATALYRWSFTTSRFETFTALARSGGVSPPVWAYSVPVGSLDAPAGSDFGTLAEAIGLPSVNAVAAVEVSALRDGGATMALLLEAPEPIDWNARVQARLNGAVLSVASNQDRTRAILRLGAGAIPSVSSTLTLTFVRDVGSALPVLSVGGDTSEEAVDLVLSLEAFAP